LKTNADPYPDVDPDPRLEHLHCLSEKCYYFFQRFSELKKNYKLSCNKSVLFTFKKSEKNLSVCKFLNLMIKKSLDLDPDPDQQVECKSGRDFKNADPDPKP